MNPKVAKLLQEGLTQHAAGKLDKARACYTQACALEPTNTEALKWLGSLTLQQGRTEEALLLLTRMLKLDTSSAPNALVLGKALLQAGKAGQAEQVLTHAVSLDDTNAEAWLLLGNARQAQGRLPEAENACRMATEKKPENGEAWMQLGLLTVARHGHPAAIPFFRKASELLPKDPATWVNLAVCITFLKDNSEAAPCLEKALKLNPDYYAAWSSKGILLERNYEITKAITCFRKAVKLNPKAMDARSCLLLNLHYDDTTTREEVFREHLAYGAQARPAKPRAFPANDTTGRPLRIAFLGADFRAHSVAYFMEPLLEGLPKERFELLIYHDHSIVDSISERFKTLAKQWRQTAGLAPATVEKMILEDRPDLLIELAGHTGPNRLPLLAGRLARVQASYLGYPDTTGVDTIDYRLGDPVCDPAEEDGRFQTEQVLRFARTAWCFRAPATAPDVAEPPSLKTPGVFHFGCFNNIAKISDTCLKEWGKLLREEPRARLLLKNHGLEFEELRARLRQRFERCGLPPEQVDFMPRSANIREHLSQYERMDLALDTYPYHGTTTTCEALWMGVPVVSLRGDRHASRVGASLLQTVGHPEWVASSWTEYRACCLDLVRDTERLKRLRNALREQMRASALCDETGQSADFARLLEEMVRLGPKQKPQP